MDAYKVEGVLSVEVDGDGYLVHTKARPRWGVLSEGDVEDLVLWLKPGEVRFLRVRGKKREKVRIDNVEKLFALASKKCQVDLAKA